MPDKSDRADYLLTPRQKALFKLLSESGASEDGTDAEGRSFEDRAPYFATKLIDGALSSNPNEEQIIDILCFGDRTYSEKARPLARKILQLLAEYGAPPA
jgi:hypothetical protein